MNAVYPVVRFVISLAASSVVGKAVFNLLKPIAMKITPTVIIYWIGALGAALAASTITDTAVEKTLDQTKDKLLAIAAKD